MEPNLSFMDEGYHLICVVAALGVIAHTVLDLGLYSTDVVTNLFQEILLLSFHLVRVRPGSGALLGVAAWLLDMTFHLWFLLVDGTRVASSLYFDSEPLDALLYANFFLFHLLILRGLTMGIHGTGENADADDSDEQREMSGG
ncbi:uncharacterized protein LOC125945662 [Dermacentor silvarum]|uniref:uncharacterized protein LOC125945662 n=1 Tax=Dermacentor silvarum TaxID=543639 RepID=UPI002100875B|nr:uncharacterized protein LOC125945662 [Dermacentor silvarum]